MTRRIVVASANPKKAAELQDLLDLLGADLHAVARPADLAVPVEDAPDFLGNARIKAAAVAAATGEWALADDSGLEVDALAGEPGVRSARFAGDHATDAQNVELLLQRLDSLGAATDADRSARFRCVIVVQSPVGEEIVAEGAVEGHIGPVPRGDGGFGYDPVFVPSSTDGGDGRTFAEMSAEEKRSISHRGRAMRDLAASLRRIG